MNDLQELKIRGLREHFEWEDHKAFMRLIKKYGVPKTEEEREELMCKAEENVCKRKDTNTKIDELLNL